MLEPGKRQNGRNRLPPLNALRAFDATARHLTVVKAADELHVTPSAVSHRVRQLEQIIGTKLFGRADFSLTTEGSEYLAHVREGLAILESWRFEQFGGDALALVEGRLAFAVRGGKLVMTRADVEPAE